MLSFVKDALIIFFVNNYIRIFIALGLLSTFFILFYFVTGTLKGLEKKSYSGYPFDSYLPQSGKWSVGYFIAAILLLGILIYLLMSGGFYLKPT